MFVKTQTDEVSYIRRGSWIQRPHQAILSFRSEFIRETIIRQNRCSREGFNSYTYLGVAILSNNTSCEAYTNPGGTLVSYSLAAPGRDY